MQCESTPGCIQAALTILGDKWSPLILKLLAENETSRYTALLEELDGISSRTLAIRLEKLEVEGIVKKQVYSIRPIRSEYLLTQKGLDLVDVLVAMGKWGEKYAKILTHSR